MTGNDPQLFFAEDGTPRSARFGDIYYSPQDGLSESRAVFLTGCHLPQGWASGGHFSVLELGFGTGLNIAAVMQAWVDHRPHTGRLHVFSIEGFLMAPEAAHAALSNWPELAAFRDALVAQWPRLRKGFHYMDFPQWGVSVTLALMDVCEALGAWDGYADAVFLDGFSPALNPDMWSEDVFRLIAARCRRGARLATFTVAGFVRRGLQAAGFTVDKRPGFGRKRERLEAVYANGESEARRPDRIAIIGAGIAGASLVYQAHSFGIEADIFDADGAGAGASGNPAALVTPRLDAGGNAISSLFADAHAYAVALYNRMCPHAILSQGVYHCESQPRDKARFDRIAEQAVFAPDSLSRFTTGMAADVPQASGLRLNDALVVSPHDVIDCLMGDQPVIIDKLIACEPVEEGVRLGFASGEVRDYDAAIIACGDGVFDLDKVFSSYGLQPVRGQVEIGTSDERPGHGISWGGYLVPSREGFLFGATHDRDDRSVDLRPEDRERNMQALEKEGPHWAQRASQIPLQSRASIRVTTRDHLPLAGQLTPNLYALTGLGARGFCLAPLLARELIARLSDAPSSLPIISKNLLTPQRLLRSSGV